MVFTTITNLCLQMNHVVCVKRRNRQIFKCMWLHFNFRVVEEWTSKCDAVKKINTNLRECVQHPQYISQKLMLGKLLKKC